MAHVRASGFTGRSSSRKKIPRLVPPLIITVRILACISTSSLDKPDAHVERFVIYSFIHSFIQTNLLVPGSTWRVRSLVGRPVRHRAGALLPLLPRPPPVSAWPRHVHSQWAQTPG